MKKIILILAMTIFTATAAFAAEGKVKSIADGSIVIEMTDDTKLKKGGSVKLNGKAGKVTDVEGNTVTIKCSKAVDLKAGEMVKVEKASMQGC